MRITVQVQIEGSDDQVPRNESVGVIERDADSSPSSGLGQFLGESHAILQKLQAVLLREETAEFVEAASRCGTCSGGLTAKDTRSLVYRTAFGRPTWTALGCIRVAPNAERSPVVARRSALWRWHCRSEPIRSGPGFRADMPA